MNAFKEACAEITAAHQKAHAAMVATYPVGSQIYYKVGVRLIAAVLIQHNQYSLDVKVRSNNSNKEYWVDAYRLT